ncbi:hypothetical protein [Streptomyces sp. NPDC045251]|uniref:hypothetical protein n=1 Tax=unclassified Streptomyces TaxID=2593676 RepID=UPI00340304EC
MGAVDRVRLGAHASPSDARALAKAFTQADFCADEAVVSLLGQVQKHCPVVLVTNATVWLDEDLTALGPADLADSVINSSLVGVAKPDRRIHEMAAKQAGGR